MRSFLDYYTFISDTKSDVLSRLGYYYHFGKGDLNREVIKPAEKFYEPIIESLRANNVGYCDPAGRKSVRKLIAYYESLIRDDPDISYANISQSLGGTNALYSSLRALKELIPERKHVLCLTPCYTYLDCITDEGFIIETLAVQDENKAESELGELPFEKYAAIILADPSFPYGKQMSEHFMSKLREISETHGIYLIIDEVYADIPVSDKVAYKPFFSDTSISIRSFSKEFSIPGLRGGYVLADEDIIEIIRQKNEYVFGTPIVAFEVHTMLLVLWKLRQEQSSSTFDVENMLEEIGTEDKQLDIISKIDLDEFFMICTEFREDMTDVLTSGLDVSERSLSGTKTLTLSRPDFGFNGVVENHTSSDYKDIYLNTGVVLTPGELFCLPGHFRFTYGDSNENIREAWDRVIGYLEK